MPHPDSFNLTKIAPKTAGQIDRLAIELSQTVLSADLFGLTRSLLTFKNRTSDLPEHLKQMAKTLFSGG